MIRQAEITSQDPDPTLAPVAAAKGVPPINDEERSDGGGKDDTNVWELLKYRPGLPAIKISLGLVRDPLV